MKQKPKEFITSSYYDLEDVHKFNLFVDSLKDQSTADSTWANTILEAKCTYLYKDELKDVVPNTPKYMDGLVRMMKGRLAKQLLKEHEFKSEEIFIVREPKHWRYYKNTFKLGYDRYTQYDRYEDYSWEVEPGSSEFTFFTVDDYPERYIEDILSLKMRYSRRAVGGEYIDLIQEHVEQSNRYMSEIRAYQACERLGISKSDLDLVFRVENISYFRDWHNWYMAYGIPVEEMDDDFTNVKKYSDKEVLALIEEAKAAREIKYVKDDKSVEYPRYMPYVDFKESLAKGEYQEYQYD